MFPTHCSAAKKAAFQALAYLALTALRRPAFVCKFMPRFLILICLSLSIALSRGWSQSPAREAGYLYLSPVPQASYVSPQTRFVLVRFVEVAPSVVTNLAEGFVTVIGETSGAHFGTTRIASDGKTVIFEMNSDLRSNELVNVSLAPRLGAGAPGKVQEFTYQFMVGAPMPGSLPPTAVSHAIPLTPPTTQKQPLQPWASRSVVKGPRKRAATLANGVSVPSDFPVSVVTVNNNPSPGFLFLENALNNVPPYTMMLDNAGLPVWYRRGRLFDFKDQKNGMITWCQYDASGLATFSAFDQNFNFLRTYGTTNGYLTDGHDLKVLPDGSYYIIAFRNNAVDLSRYIANAPKFAVVTETVVQGFTASDELVFQWRSWDNYDIRDLVPLANTDFAHMNGIDIDEDGNILVSARHLSEVTKINRDSGDIMWRLSGAHSSFAFVGDPLNGTSYQHNISALGNGSYMVFDNGDYRSTALSRAVEYQIDLTNRTATMIWQFRDKPDKYTYWLGSAQRLPSGNTLIDFVLSNYPKAIEVDPQGVKRFELTLVPGSDSYRAFRFPWNGSVAAPYLIVEPQTDNVTLIFNKFGDTNVAYFRVYGGTTPHPTNVLAESTATLKQLSDLQNGLHYFRVTAVNRQGVESPFSNEESLNVNMVQAGQDLVQNGNFDQDTQAWNLNLKGIAVVSWTNQAGVSQCNITNGGMTLSSVQLVQTGIPLALGEPYVLQFDAWSDQPRYIKAQVAQSVSPLTDYSQVPVTLLTPNRTHYRYLFTMRQPTDPAANLLFNLGGSSGMVYLDDISLFVPFASDLNQDGLVDLLDLEVLCGNWLKQQPNLPGDFDRNGKIDFNDFSRLAQKWNSVSP